MNSKKYPLLNNKNYLYEIYINKKISSDEIAVMLGCSGQLVLNYLDYHKIPIRNYGDWLIIDDNNGVVDNKDVINGLMLGDGHISRLVERGNPRITIHQKQKDFVIFLRNLICPKSKITEQKPRISILNNGRIIKGNGSFICRSGCSPVLLPYYNSWYSNGKKIVPNDLELSPITVLHWFMGDGSSYKRKGYNSIEIKLFTNDFTLEEVNFLVERFNEMGFKFYLTYRDHTDPNRGYVMRLSTTNSYDFFHFIGPCPIKCMEYKWKI